MDCPQWTGKAALCLTRSGGRHSPKPEGGGETPVLAGFWAFQGSNPPVRLCQFFLQYSCQIVIRVFPIEIGLLNRAMNQGRRGGLFLLKKPTILNFVNNLKLFGKNINDLDS
jgi:hypothetical protein